MTSSFHGPSERTTASAPALLGDAAAWRRSRRRAIVLAPRPLATCSAAVPTPPAAPWTSTVSPSLQAPAQQQREVGGVVVEDQRRALGEVELRGERKGQELGCDGRLGEAAERAERRDAVAGLTAAPAGASRTIARDLAAGHERQRRFELVLAAGLQHLRKGHAGGVHVDDTPAPGVRDARARARAPRRARARYRGRSARRSGRRARRGLCPMRGGSPIPTGLL